MVHDPTARRMGGVAGHAGLFTTAADLARYCRMLLNGGELEGCACSARPRFNSWFPCRPRRTWWIVVGSGGTSTAVMPARGALISRSGRTGHTGWTGTSLWIDPFSRTFVILLSNRNHPTEAASVVALRRQVGTLAAEAVADFNFLYVPGALARRPADSEPAAPSQDRPGDERGGRSASRQIRSPADFVSD